MISSLNLLKTEVEMKQGKAGEASSLMITHQVYKMCADCLIAKVLNWGSMMMVRRRWKPVVEILGSTSDDVW